MNKCLASVQACALRVGRLQSNGRTAAGVAGQYTTGQFTTVSVSAEVEEGDEINVKNACGGLCVSFKDCDRLKRLSLELELCVPDPELHEILIGGTVLTSGAATGYAYPQLNAAGCPNGVSLEIWTKHVDSGGAQDGQYPYLRWVFPRTYLQVGDKNFENDAMASGFSGFAVENPNWFDGPQNDWPVASNRVAQWLPVATLPPVSCGYSVALAS